MTVTEKLPSVVSFHREIRNVVNEAREAVTGHMGLFIITNKRQMTTLSNSNILHLLFVVLLTSSYLARQLDSRRSRDNAGNMTHIITAKSITSGFK